MASSYRSGRIETLEPSKLSQSIKSGFEYAHEHAITSNHEPSRTLPHDALKKKPGITSEVYDLRIEEQHSHTKSSHEQVDKLNQLRREYDLLKNIKIEDSVVYARRGGNQDDASFESSDRSEKSVTRHSHRNRAGATLEYEKKQLELMLNNSMLKIEELLKAEVDYKKRIYELTRNVPDRDSYKSERVINEFKQNEAKLNRSIEELKAKGTRLEGQNNEISIRLRQMEQQLEQMQFQLKKQRESKRRCEENLLFEKQANMNIKIQIKRIQLEKEMLSKEFNFEVQRTKRASRDYQMQRQRLSHKIREQQELINELKAKSSQAGRDYKINGLQNKLPHSSQELQARMAQKIKQLEKAGEKHAHRQIGLLRDEVQLMRSKVSGGQKVELEKKVQALQKVVEQDSKQKASFLEQLKQVLENFHQLQAQNQELRDQLRKIQAELRTLKQSSAYELERSQQMPRTPRSEEQVNTYINRIKKLEAENRQMRAWIARMEEDNSLKESRVQEKVKQYARRMQQSELEIEKLIKQNQFNVEMINAKSKAEVELLRNDLARALRQRDDERIKFESAKSFLEDLVEGAKREKAEAIKTYAQKIQAKQQQLVGIRNNSQQAVVNVRKQYEKQLLNLLARLDEMIKTNELYVQENVRLMSHEVQLHELRQRVRRMAGLNEGVDHLWNIKEMEYHNLNLLLQQLK